MSSGALTQARCPGFFPHYYPCPFLWFRVASVQRGLCLLLGFKLSPALGRERKEKKKEVEKIKAPFVGRYTPCLEKKSYIKKIHF